MLTTSETQEIGRASSRINLIRGAMFGGLGVYVLIVNLLVHVLEVQMPLVADSGEARFAKYGYGLYGIAAIALALAYVLRRAIAGQRGAASALDRLVSLLSVPAPAEGVASAQAAIGFYNSGMLICLALCESIGLLGLIGFVLRADYLQFYMLVGVSAAALAYIRPQGREVAELAVKLEQEREARRRFPKH